MSVISSSFRQRFRAAIEGPVGRFFARTRVTPNALTLLGFAISLVGGYFAGVQSWLACGLIVAVGAAFDLFDGALARATGRTSTFGAFLDSTMDRAGEAVVYIGIAAGVVGWNLEGPDAGAVLFVLAAIAAMAASFMVSYTRAKSESLGFSSGTGMASVGIAPREIRMVILVIGLIGTGLTGGIGTMFYPTTGQGLPLLGALALIAVLATITTIQRIYFVYRQSQSTNQEAQK
jgi:CDP-diacylglycerol--glycerol-3-phosphate 3-phosphatidyltransferase